MIAGLSASSSYGLWILLSHDSNQIITSVSWVDGESSGLSDRLIPMFEKLLVQGNISRDKITKLFGVSGPGAFTGLRMSGAFLLGLARALDRPLVSVPTIDLNDSSFWIPLRHQLSKSLSLSQALERGIEFLKVGRDRKFEIGIPKEGDIIWGLNDRPEWPSTVEFQRAIQKNLDKSAPFEVIYGLEPKISGLREQK